MTLYVRGNSKTIKEQDIIQAAEGNVCENYKKPLRYIHLTWANFASKKIGNRSKFKGFEDTFLTLQKNGGIKIKHRIPGAARFIKNMLGGKYTAVLADTVFNRRYLASMYYDKLWTIKEADVEAAIKVAADAIDEQLKKNKVTYTIDVPIRDRHGMVTEWGKKVVVENEYEFHKRRRESHYTKDSRHKMRQSTTQPMHIDEDKTSNVAIEKADIAKKQAELDEREANLKIAEDAMEKNINSAKGEKLDLNTEYNKEDLLKLRPISKLRKIAKELGSIKETSRMVTDDLVAEILNLQAKAAIVPETGVTDEVEAITA